MRCGGGGVELAGKLLELVGGLANGDEKRDRRPPSVDDRSGVRGRRAPLPLPPRTGEATADTAPEGPDDDDDEVVVVVMAERPWSGRGDGRPCTAVFLLNITFEFFLSRLYGVVEWLGLVSSLSSRELVFLRTTATFIARKR